MPQPLTDAINALTTYANTVTGASDTTLSDAVATLASGYGGGGASLDGIADGTEPTGTINLTATSIRYGAFAYTPNLVTVNMPNVTKVDNYAFFHSNVSSVYAPLLAGNASSADAFAYTKLTKITDAEFPNLTSCNKNGTTYMFEYCTDVEKIFLSKLNETGTGTFRRQTSLLTVVCKNFSGYLGNNTFEYCTALTAVDMKKPSIAAGAFGNCTNLNTLILRDDSAIATLANVNALNNNTCFKNGGSGGTLYVPQSLISSYQSASNWSTILGYANNSIKSIESTHTDPNAPIDLTLYYADGTPIE